MLSTTTTSLMLSSSSSTTLKSSSSSSPAEHHSVNLIWDNIYGLIASAIVTVCVIYFVLRPVTLRPPKDFRRRHHLPSWLCFPIDYATAPIIGVVLLLILQVFSFQGVYNGLKGNENIQPYTIIVIFFGLAYMSISFDCTGSFEFLALLAIRKSGTSAKKLYAYFWIVTSFVTVVASNDVAILTITPIICHFTQKMRLNPIPFLLMEFMAANIWSMTLFIGNPTNIIVGIAYKMSFVGYTMWMGIVAVVSGVLHFFIMKFMVRKDLEAPMDPSAAAGVVPSSVIKSKFGAIFGCICLGTCIILLCISYWIGVELYVLCGIFWAIYLVKDIAWDIATGFCCKRHPVALHKKFTPLPTESPAIGMEELGTPKIPTAMSVSPEPSEGVLSEDKSKISCVSPSQDIVPSESPASLGSSGEEKSGESDEEDEEEEMTVVIDDPEFNDDGEEEVPLKERFWNKVGTKLPTISAVGRRMPWKILPFVLGMFVLVQCLKDVGWVNNAAYLVSKISLNNTIFSTFLSGIIFTFFALAINNQPMTILGTMILQEASFSSLKVEKAWALGLILGSNICANFTIFGALAGIMFIAIVQAHGVRLDSKVFSKYGFISMPLILIISCVIIALELTFFPENLGQ